MKLAPLFVAVLALGFVGCGNEGEINKLEEDLASAEGLAAGYKAERNAARAEAKELQRKVSGLRVRVADLQIIVDDLEQQQFEELPYEGGDGFEDEAGCAPGYDQCLDPSVYDYDCAGGSGDGPGYVEGPIEVYGDDPYGLDADYDGVGCV